MEIDLDAGAPHQFQFSIFSPMRFGSFVWLVPSFKCFKSVALL